MIGEVFDSLFQLVHFVVDVRPELDIVVEGGRGVLLVGPLGHGSLLVVTTSQQVELVHEVFQGGHVGTGEEVIDVEVVFLVGLYHVTILLIPLGVLIMVSTLELGHLSLHLL